MENWQSFIEMFHRHDWTIDMGVADYTVSRVEEDSIGCGIYTLTDDSKEELARGDIFSVTVTLLFTIGVFNSKDREREYAPYFQHNCSLCIFLGGYRPPVTYEYESYYDLYWCPQIGTPTIMARFGNEGPEYTSGAPLRKNFYEEHFYYPTCEGYRRALAKGLDIPEPR